MKEVYEVNFDGLVGPTHNYSGLSYGNIASTAHKALVSNPLSAVLQGLEKMKKLADLGLKQALLPPQERPDLRALRKLGFSGNDVTVLKNAAKDAPQILEAVCSASSMWTANSGTVSPSADTSDQKVHFTPANLVSKFHRSLETETTSKVFRKIFESEKFFVHHDALPSTPTFGDEGAANHTRLCAEYGEPGVELFVYGRSGFNTDGLEPKKFPARQTQEASETIARLHLLDRGATIVAQQNSQAIDAGVFHNDVVGVGNQDVYFYHEKSFQEPKPVLDELTSKFQKVCGKKLKLICVPALAINLEDVVKSYLFNSQLISLPKGGMALIMPKECESTPAVFKYLGQLKKNHGDIIKEFIFMDLKQSMRNGGGPACLRFRVVLSQDELKAIRPKVFLTDKLYGELVSWAKKHYRDRLNLDDLRDPKLLKESREALDELTSILEIGSIYPFQS